jgi:hypothetical protein
MLSFNFGRSFDKVTSRIICTTKLKQGQYGHSPSSIHSTKTEGVVLPNVLQNGFSSSRGAAPSEEPELEPFSEEPELCQTCPLGSVGFHESHDWKYYLLICLREKYCFSWKNKLKSTDYKTSEETISVFFFFETERLREYVIFSFLDYW